MTSKPPASQKQTAQRDAGSQSWISRQTLDLFAIGLSHSLSKTAQRLARPIYSQRWKIGFITAGMLVLAIVVDLILVVPGWTNVQVEWQPILAHGFPSGAPFSIQAIASSPDSARQFVSTYNGGVFRSDDQGESW